MIWNQTYVAPCINLLIPPIYKFVVTFQLPHPLRINLPLQLGYRKLIEDMEINFHEASVLLLIFAFL